MSKENQNVITKPEDQALTDSAGSDYPITKRFYDDNGYTIGGYPDDSQWYVRYEDCQSLEGEINRLKCLIQNDQDEAQVRNERSCPQSSGSISLWEFLDRGLFKANGVWTTDRYGRCGLTLIDVLGFLLIFLLSFLLGFLISN
jgi:hypothetical protein